jgi:hypothetical protein
MAKTFAQRPQSVPLDNGTASHADEAVIDDKHAQPGHVA